MWSLVSDHERDAIVLKIIEAFATSGVPDHLRAGLVRYFSDGIMPGSFLQAVLCNDLIEAVRRADPSSRSALPSLIDFLMMHAPAQAWGSRERVLAWSTTPERLEV
jgi:hypothetical protein